MLGDHSQNQYNKDRNYIPLTNRQIKSHKRLNHTAALDRENQVLMEQVDQS
jgi:hypothetical protein